MIATRTWTDMAIQVWHFSAFSEVLREGCIEPPVPDVVGVGESVSCHAAADAHVAEFVGPGTQTGFDVAQARAPGEFGERHAPELIGAGE